VSVVEAEKERVARGYSRSASEYDALAGQLYINGIRRLLPRLRVRRGAAVLDVGSGTGLNLLEAASWLAPTRLLCGIDIAPGMVAVAQEKASRLGVPAQFTVGDAEQLPYPDGLFDLVICNSVFHWFADRQKAMREIARVLRPGGQVALICASQPAFNEWFHLIDAIMGQVTGGRARSAVPSLPGAPEVAACATGASLVIDHLMNPIFQDVVHEPDRFVHLMTTVAPQWAADLTPTEQAQVEATAANLMRAGWPQGFPVSWAATELIATKR
jgi:ubiquinone/menaquinone biosynthesis C-methylase UbiE